MASLLEAVAVGTCPWMFCGRRNADAPSDLVVRLHVSPMEPLAPSSRRPPRKPSAGPARAGALAAVAALLFGITIVAQRALALDGVPALSVVGLRYGIGALLLLVFLAGRREPLVPEAGERLRAILLGAGGYAIQAVLFYLALRHGSAGTVAMLFYVYPAIVVLIEVVFGRVRPGPLILLSVLLACSGAAVVVTAGRAVQVTLVGAGLALTSAVCIAVYLTVNARLLPRTRPAVSAAWVSLGTALSTLVLAGVQAFLRCTRGSGSGWASPAARPVQPPPVCTRRWLRPVRAGWPLCWPCRRLSH
ncbi:DMT family transporter [Blastococcus sp. HT6-4]